MVGVYRIYPKKRSSFFANFSINTNLILINIFLYIIFKILIYNNLKFWDYIAINPYNIIQGEYIWTFLTSMFMHVNTLHIFANMLSLFFIGTLVEKILGAKRYLYFYLISGLFAGLFFVLSSTHSFILILSTSKLFIKSDLNNVAL